MRNNRRSLLEVHGISHSVMQKHPRPDTDYGGRNVESADHIQRPISGLWPIPGAYSDLRTPSRNSVTNFGTLSNDGNIGKRTQSLQTVFSNQTESSCSWSEDNDKELTEKVRKKLQESDDTLYDSNLRNVGEIITEEDKSWMMTFPYLRVVGKQITPCTVFDSSDTKESKVLPQNEETLSIEHEEILAEDGIYEENAVEDSNTSSSSSECSHEYSARAREKIKDKILERLTDHLMSKVAEWIAALSENRRKHSISRIRSSVTMLPPLTTADSPPSRRSPVSRPLTSLQQKRRLPVLSEKPLGPEKYLQGLLTISSKVLQTRLQNKSTYEWYREILSPPQNSKQSSSSNHMRTSSAIRQASQQVEVENNASLPNIHQKMNTNTMPLHVNAQHYGKTEADITQPSLPLPEQRLLTTSNLPLFKNDSFSAQQSFTTKRISSAFPNKPKSGFRRVNSTAVRRSHTVDQMHNVHINVPSTVQYNSSQTIDSHNLISPFTLLPIVKSLTPLASISRPKSQSAEKRN